MAETDGFWLLTFKQTAERLNVSLSQVEKLAAAGKLPLWRPSERVVRVKYWELIQQISSPGVTLEMPSALISRTHNSAFQH